MTTKPRPMTRVALAAGLAAALIGTVATIERPPAHVAADGPVAPVVSAPTDRVSVSPAVGQERSGPTAAEQQTVVVGLQSGVTPGCTRVEGADPPTLDCTVQAGDEFVQNLTGDAHIRETGAALPVTLDVQPALSGATFRRVDTTGTEVDGPVSATGEVAGRFRWTPGMDRVTAADAPWVFDFTAASDDSVVSAHVRTRLHVLGNRQALLGYVFDDANGSGNRDVAETGAAGWHVELAGPGGAHTTVLTDANGRFSFAIAATGRYTVTAESRNGWLATRPTSVPVQVADLSHADQPVEVLFAFQRTGGPSTLTATVGTDRGCREAAQNTVFRLGEQITVSLGVQGAAQADVTLVNRLANGTEQVLLSRRSVPGNQTFSFRGTAAPPTGVESVRLDAFLPTNSGPVPDASSTCSYTVAATAGPDLDVAPPSVDFAAVIVGGSATRPMTLRNVGQSNLLVFQLGLQGGAASAFHFVGSVASSFALAPGAAYTFNLVFNPGAAGSYDDYMIVRSNDPDEATIAVPLHGQTVGTGYTLSAHITTDRGCLEAGQRPLYFVGDPIQLGLRVDGTGFNQALATVEDINAVGQSARLYRQMVPANRDIGLGGLRVAPPLGVEAVRLTAQVSADLWARDTCSFNVAAGATRWVGYKFEDLNGDGVWEGNPNTPWLPGHEPPVPGWSFAVVGPDSQSVTTDANGRFELWLTTPGTYTVTEEGRAGWRATTPPQVSATVRVFPGEELPIALFGNQRSDVPPTATPIVPTPIVPTPPRGTPVTLTATPTLASPTPTEPPSACRVHIDFPPGTMNVGERAAFDAVASGGSGGYTYQWTVQGDVLKDYSETTNQPWRATPMDPVDYRGANLAFYWQPDPSQRYPLNSGPVARRVSVAATTGGGTCHDQVVMNVERNNASANRQAEDIYLANHGGLVLREHTLWHQTHVHTGGGYDGTLFFDFHNAFIGRFNSWRGTFGYPPVVTWDPAGGIPRGADVDHTPRNSTYIAQPKPSWFTTDGSLARPGNRMPCDTSGGGERQLADFPADRRLLGCAVTEPWHNGVHAAVGGDMLNINTSPRDPLFFRWHAFIDEISQQRLGLAGAAPQVVYQSPFRLFHYQLDLGAVAVTFSKPVSGVTADQLTVNGQPATTVTGTGAGPYVFNGFPTLPPGEVAVALVSGRITDSTGDTFAGDAWHHVLVDPAPDSDGDGLSNGDEVSVYLTDPFLADSDSDGLPDGAEVTAYHTDPRWPDTDNDGAPDGCELAKGSNPRDPGDVPAEGCRVTRLFLPWAGAQAVFDGASPPELAVPASWQGAPALALALSCRVNRPH